MRKVPEYPKNFPAKLTKPLCQFAQVWSQSDLRPVPSKRTIAHWDKLIEQWAEDSELPLLVRKTSNKYGRGVKITHTEGRKIIPVDNSPATWAYAKALREERPSIKEVHQWIKKDLIPVAMVLKKDEVKQEQPHRKKCTLGKAENLNAKGWKVAHIDPVGLRRKNHIKDIPLEILKDRFRRLMSPSNIFLVPCQWSGLAEIPEMLEAMKKVQKN